MANIKYFTECHGETVRLFNIGHSGAVSSAAEEFKGTCPDCGAMHQASRKVEFKSFPSLHTCSARCQSAKGHSCECSCGGANHGKAA